MPLRKFARSIYYALKLDDLKTRIKHRGLTNDDLFLGSYMRSGSTWLQHQLYELLTGEIADHDKMDYLIPLVGQNYDLTPIMIGKNGRVIKSHNIFKPYYKKSIYLVRDPRRVAISEYKYLQLYNRFEGSFNDFITGFSDGSIRGKGNWGNHVRSWLRASETGRTDMLLLKYEDFRENTHGSLARIAGFLDLNRSDEDLDLVVEHNTLANMKKREDDSKRKDNYARNDMRVINEGKTGDWSGELNEEQEQQITKAYNNEMKILGYL